MWLLVWAGVLLVAPRPALAQDTVSDIVTFLMTNQAVPTADLERDRQAAEAARDTIARALLVNLTTVPIATASSGFLYRLNPELGTVQRATESFGAFFTERALTAGAGRASFGISGSTAAFTRLDGHSLRDGTLLTIANQFRDEPAPYNTETLTLRVRSSTMTLLGSVGVTDRLEIGAAVPFVQLTLDGERLNVYRGTPFLQARGSAEATGIADIAVRAKYTLLAAHKGGVAAAAELRLPTGDAENLLGAGATSWRVLGIFSLDNGSIGLHGNAGIVRGGVSNEFTFAAAVSAAVRPRVTLSAEVYGHYLQELRDILLAEAPHPLIVGVDTLRLMPGTSGTTLLTGLAGIKWNVADTLVLGAHVAVPLGERGLTAAITPTVALEYAFTR